MAGTNSSIKALRWLLRDNIIPRNVMLKHIREVTGKNDRLIAVVGGSQVEGVMRALLKANMPNGPGTLFDSKSALSTFAAVIDLAYAFGLIDADIKRNSHYIREIRNVFAHRIAPTSFKTKEVANVCKLLVLGRHEGRENVNSDMRARYQFAVVHTGGAIAVARFKSGTPPPPASLSQKRSLQPL